MKSVAEIMVMPWSEMSEEEKNVARENKYWQKKGAAALAADDRNDSAFQAAVQRAGAKALEKK